MRWLRHNQRCDPGQTTESSITSQSLRRSASAILHRRDQNGQDGLWIIDDDANTVFANDRMAEILGTTQSEMVRQNSFDYIYPEDLESAQRLFRKKMDGSRAPFQFRLRKNDGRPVWVDVQATPMFNAEGRFTGIVGTFTAVPETGG